MNHLKPIAVILLMVSITACREEYYYDTRHLEDILIVEGLITDLPGPQMIKLSYSVAAAEEEEEETGFGGDYHLPGIKPAALTGASVTVTDHNGDTYIFHENSPGKYYSDSTFRGIAGYSYTLHIDTPFGEQYESSPQVMGYPVETDTLFYEEAVMESLYETVFGSLITHRVRGRDLITDIRTGTDNPARFRIVTRLLVVYETLRQNRREFAWKHIPASGLVNMNSQIRENTDGIFNNHKIGFIPTTNSGLGLYQELGDSLLKQYILIRYFSLNNDSWDFYRTASDQLSREDRIFDPAVQQLPANIYCISDPSRPVLGLFEVSATTSETWYIVEYELSDLYRFMRIRDLHGLPDRGGGVYGIDPLPDFFYEPVPL